SIFSVTTVSSPSCPGPLFFLPTSARRRRVVWFGLNPVSLDSKSISVLPQGTCDSDATLESHHCLPLAPHSLTHSMDCCPHRLPTSSAPLEHSVQTRSV
ncbi:hypothetical protein CPAR01_02385, partial [Colletotrichum paranaense]